MRKMQPMEIIFYTGKDRKQSLRQFAEKRTEFLAYELRNFTVEELKVLPTVLKNGNHTFEQKWSAFYN